DAELVRAKSSRDALREQSTDRERLQAQLIAQARTYALQRYMYGSSGSRDLLAFLAALSKPADDAVWGLATLEVTSEAALDQAQQVATARAAVADRLAEAESDVMLLGAARTRRAQELDATTALRAEAASRFEGVVRELGQATVNGMSTVAYDAYRQAETTLAAEQPGCGLRWELLAAIGKTESNHGVGRLDAAGNSQVAIIGIPIGGDTDGGTLDGDAGRDHAVGPMQFIPSTWARWGTDANGDGKADPGNIVDAATAAGRYLCRAAGDLTLTSEAGVIRAILSYNPNQTYLRVVGARFESLANDLAQGWFSAATLPPPPPPVADLTANGGPDGRTVTPTPAVPPPPQTLRTEVQVFGAQDLATSTTAPLAIQPGGCLGPSLVLEGRAGFQRCQPTDGVVLDPCQTAPYDPTLVACLPDPTGVPVLLRLPAPGVADAPGPPPPYRLLALDGGDRCLPIPGPEPVTSPPPTSPPPTTTPPTTSTPAPSSSSPTTTASNTSTTAATTAVSAATSEATSSAAPAAPAPAAAATRAATKAAATSTSTPATSTSTPTTSPPPPTTLPVAQRPTYACASGATVIGLPDRSGPSWTVLVRTPGLADRQLPVVQAYS
ncbi:MAG TPA: lytic transglycosylase domain-containing protein, partial [Acidimicrobiales bacterium]